MTPRRRPAIAALLLALLLPAVPEAAERAVVTSAHPIASAAGKAILDQGGNAIDAAVAVQMALSVVEPHASGIGGGAFLLLWDPARPAVVRAFDGLASQPARAAISISYEADGSRLPYERVENSGRSVGVPGAVAMLAELHAKEGRLPWSALFAPAIRAAEDGFPMPPYLHHALVVVGAKLKDPALRAEWMDADGRPRPLGTIVRNQAQAASLRLIAEKGADALRQGELARAIIAAVTSDEAAPGWMTEADLAAYRPRERDALCAPALGHRICSMPPPSYGGVVTLQILAMAGQHGIASLPPDSPAAAHLFLEASRLAYADRLLHIGDPDFEQVPTAGLVDPIYLRQRASQIRADAVIPKVTAGDPPGRRADIEPSEPGSEPTTSHLAIVDRDGRIVSMTTTINLYFGSKIAAGGFFLNNALTNFSAQMRDGQLAVNRMMPGKRPYTSMAPTIAFDAAGKPVLAVGAAGGVRIPSYVAQAELGVLAWGMDIATALAQPHWHNANSQSEVESETPAVALQDALRALGHQPKVQAMQSGLAGITRTPAGWVGAADPRRDGAAVSD